MHRARHPRLETEPRAGVDKMILFFSLSYERLWTLPHFQARVFETRKWPCCRGGGRVGGGGGGEGVWGVLEILKPAAAL